MLRLVSLYFWWSFRDCCCVAMVALRVSYLKLTVPTAACCQEWLKAMPSCHYRILSHARYAHASDKPHACDDTVAVHVWQGTRMHCAWDAHAMSNVHASSDAVV